MPGAAGLPSLAGLEALLGSYAGSNAYVIKLEDDAGRPIGNNGDTLMFSVFHRMLAGLGIRTVCDSSDADFLVLPPNGALLENYRFPIRLTKRLAVLPDIPLVIFPSSAFFPKNDPMALFGQRRASTLWILRERYSFAHLKSKWGCQLSRGRVDLELDHDVVASGHRYLRDVIKGPVTDSTVLVAARNDREASPAVMFRQEVSLPAANLRLRSLVVDRVSRLPWATGGARIVRAGRHQAMGRALLDAAEAVGGIEQQDRTSPLVYCDVSATQFASFRYYSRQIRQAGLVVTNRLHVGLPSAALGKRVVLVEGGYHKLQGVYEQSLSTLDNVLFVGKSR